MPTKSGIRTMRSHVSRFGRLSGILIGNLTSVQFLVDLFGERPADSVNLGEIFDACRQQSSQTAETRQQLLPPLCTDAADRLKWRGGTCFRAACAMTRDGEAV